MKKTSLFVAGLMAMTMATSAWAGKIGVVNPERILRESAAAEQAHELLKKEFAKREAALATASKVLKADVEEYQKKRESLSETQRAITERKLADQERTLQRRNREMREDLNRRRNEELQGILMRSNEIIQEIAKKDKYDLIVQEAVYANPEIDITDRVIKALAEKRK